MPAVIVTGSVEVAMFPYRSGGVGRSVSSLNVADKSHEVAASVAEGVGVKPRTIGENYGACPM